jgi:hemoglobin/transferrin/lactoferrin receptor protein
LLKPEKSRGFEIGARGRMERLNLDVTAFTNHYTNLIVDAEFIQQVGNNRLFQAVNIPNARIHGLEAKGSYDMGVVGDGRLLGNFSWGMAKGTNRQTGKPLNSVDPSQLTLGLRYDTAPWSVFADVRHYAAKKAGDIDSTAIMNARDGVQFTTPAATTLDVGAQWRVRKDLRLNFAVRNLTNRKYWLWPDAYGLATASPTKDAFTQPGRSAHVSLVMDF